jgi:non-specific serine/threonine protein kinase/serine/threonine-protein kinase
MEKERTRRYASASELAADIERHLRDELVLASPPGAVYRARKFVRKHRGAVSGTLIALLCLQLGIAVNNAFRFADEAQRQFRTSLDRADSLKRLASNTVRI